MKQLLAVLLSALFSIIGYQLPALGEEAGSSYLGEEVVANQIIVSVVKGTKNNEIVQLFDGSARSYELISPLDFRTYLVSTKLFSSIAEQISFFESSELVEYAEPICIGRVALGHECVIRIRGKRRMGSRFHWK
jgi:hypothetical protein